MSFISVIQKPTTADTSNLALHFDIIFNLILKIRHITVQVEIEMKNTQTDT